MVGWWTDERARIVLPRDWRRQAVLKRILKVQHPMLQLHVLKLIKSQVPFCGRKWRQCERGPSVDSAASLLNDARAP